MDIPHQESLFNPGDDDTDEGIFDAQLSLPMPFVKAPTVFTHVRKRDGREEYFDKQKIGEAIFKAAETVGGQDRDLADSLANAVTIYLTKRLADHVPTVDHIHDAVERVLIHMAHGTTALAYARYRDRRARIRRLRAGDMKVLLGELEEARHEREALGGHPDGALLVRSSSDTLDRWDRERIIAALTRETGLEYGLASIIAAEVELQIERANIQTLTSSLVREMVDAKLVEHGLVNYRERHRRLGLPLYETARIISGSTAETVGQDPVATDRILAQAVKKEFALAEVFSSTVTEAHLRGEIHIGHLGRIDRLQQAEHSLKDLAQFGLGAPGQGLFTEAPQSAEALLALMLKFTSLMEQQFTGSILWDGINVHCAPFLQNKSSQHIYDFARMLVYEFAFRAVSKSSDPVPVVLRLYWSIPEHLCNEEAVGPVELVGTKLYSEYLHSTQQLAQAIVTVFREHAADGIFLPSPRLEIVVDEAFFRADGHAQFLEHCARVVSHGGQVSFVRNLALDEVAQKKHNAHHVVSKEVALNLPRIAYDNAKESAFMTALDTALDLAAKALEEHLVFISNLFAKGAMGPLAILAMERNETAYVNLDRVVGVIGLDGLNEAVQILLNAELDDSEEALALGKRIAERAQKRCARLSRDKGMIIQLGQNDLITISHRFATIDLQNYPKTARAVVKTAEHTPLLHYTTGVRLKQGHGLHAMESLLCEAAIQQKLDQGQQSSLVIPEPKAEATSIADFVRKAVRNHPGGRIVLGS